MIRCQYVNINLESNRRLELKHTWVLLIEHPWVQSSINKLAIWNLQIALLPPRWYCKVNKANVDSILTEKVWI